MVLVSCSFARTNNHLYRNCLSFVFSFLRSSIGGVSACDRFQFLRSLRQPHSGRLRGVQDKCMLVIFMCFHNPPNSDMDYRIFNVRACIVFRMRVYTHGGWEHRQRISTTFLTRKNSQIRKKTNSCSPDGIRTFVLLDLESDALPTEPSGFEPSSFWTLSPTPLPTEPSGFEPSSFWTWSPTPLPTEPPPSRHAPRAGPDLGLVRPEW